MKTIDITPSWRGIVGPMLAVLQNPEASEDAKEEIRDEFFRMASFIDEVNSRARKEGKGK
jgi:hypothetical protein